MSKGRSESKGISLEDLMEGSVSSEQVAELRFEEALARLEGVVAAVESGDLHLDQAIGSYEKRTQLVQLLRSLLAGAEEKLRVLGEAGA